MGLNQFSDKLDSELAKMLTMSVPDNVNVTKSNIHRRKKGGTYTLTHGRILLLYLI